VSEISSPKRLYLASGNAGKLLEYRALAETGEYELQLLPGFAKLTEFPEVAPTFAENAAGKALYYSRGSEDVVFADDSGLVVPALGGAPGVLSARYAGPGASDAQKIAKLLGELQGKTGAARNAHFVCVIAAARQSRAVAVVSGRSDGSIAESAMGSGGFGYDPIFYCRELGKSFAELPAEQKNLLSHRGRAFRRLMEVLK
jgi:XTP/dITP diphosphohydrolase